MSDRCCFNDSEDRCVLGRSHADVCQSMPKVGDCYTDVGTGLDVVVSTVETSVTFGSPDEIGTGRQPLDYFLDHFDRAVPHVPAVGDVYAFNLSGKTVNVALVTDGHVVIQWDGDEKPYPWELATFETEFALVVRA